MPEAPSDLLSISEAARKIGVNKSTLARQLKGGSVALHEGKVSYAEVLAFRASAIDLTRSHRGAGKLDDFGVPEIDATPSPADATIRRVDATADATPTDATPEADGEDGAPVLVDGEVLSYADARALKETYLARLKGLELATKRGELAPVAAIESFLDRMLGVVRERFLAIPGKLSGDLDERQFDRVSDEVHEALEELHAQGAIAEALGTPRSDDDGDADDA